MPHMRAWISRRARRQYLSAAVCSLLLLAVSLSALARGAQNKIDLRALHWNPPNVDGRLKNSSGSPTCVLSDALQQAAIRAEEMKNNLPKFTADETIQYESIAQSGVLPVFSGGTFQYLAILTPAPWGVSIQEIRTPTEGSTRFPASVEDRGLAEMALIFLPQLQSDYDMKCEGQANWRGQPAWVIHFQQRPGTTPHTFSYEDLSGGVHSASLKGRAWISTVSGNVIHLETKLMHGIPALDLGDSWLSVDYGPVQFHSRNVRLWLPQTVYSYTQFTDLRRHRTVTYHTFANFMLFSITTHEVDKIPAKPH